MVPVIAQGAHAAGEGEEEREAGEAEGEGGDFHGVTAGNWGR